MALQSTPHEQPAGRVLAAVARRLRDAGVLALDVGRPDGDGWLTLDHVAEVVEDWHAELSREHGDRRAAAVHLATWLAAAPSLVIGLPALVGGVVPEVAPDDVWLRRHPHGGVDRHAIAPRGVDDGSQESCLAVAAGRIAELTAPLVAQLCDRLPVGAAALWGGVADAIGAHALWFARQTDGDGTGAWVQAERLFDHLEQASAVRQRPRLFPVTWTGGTTHYAVRCTCCLYHRTAAAADAREASYCATCPLRSDESRNALLVAHLESVP